MLSSGSYEAVKNQGKSMKNKGKSLNKHRKQMQNNGKPPRVCIPFGLPKGTPFGFPKGTYSLWAPKRYSIGLIKDRLSLDCPDPSKLSGAQPRPRGIR